MEYSHKSVLLVEAVSGLNIKKGGVYVDGTTGGAGHSYQIAKRLSGGRLICIDKDNDALMAARERLKGLNCDITYVHADFKELSRILQDLGVKNIDGMLLDLGVSSYQLDEKNRGFSYMEEDAPLDMRMNRQSGITAADILNDYQKEDLIRIFRDYGEERQAKRIANAVVVKRDLSPIRTAGELNRIIRDNYPKNAPGGHPSKRVFMALRIEVNKELSGLYDFLYELPDYLNDGGRISVISFHSLEDKAVKNAFRDAQDPCTCPRDFPVCICGKRPKGLVITKKPILPTEEEKDNNTRSKSAKLRIFERRILESI